MQSKTTRGVRRLIVSTGVIALVLSVAAPAALADGPGRQPGAAEHLVPICHRGMVLWVAPQGAAHGHELGHGPDDVVPVEGQACDADGVVQAPTEDPGPVGGSADPNPGAPANPDPDGGPADPNPGGPADPNPGAPVQDGGDDDSVTPEDMTADAVESGAEENPGVDVPEDLSGPIISATSIERPVPATPAVPAKPAVPATPSVPATPAVPAKPAVPATPSVPATPAQPTPITPSTASTASTTSRGNEVLGSVTTRTPGGTTVTALAATGSSTTVALAALGTALLLAGLGLQVGARRRVRASDVGA